MRVALYAQVEFGGQCEQYRRRSASNGEAVAWLLGVHFAEEVVPGVAGLFFGGEVDGLGVFDADDVDIDGPGEVVVGVAVFSEDGFDNVGEVEDVFGVDLDEAGGVGGAGGEGEEAEEEDGHEEGFLE